MTREQLLRKIDEVWSMLQASYAGLTDAHMTEAGVTGNWSAKDILAHVTIWEEEALKSLPLIAEGGTTPRYAAKYGDLLVPGSGVLVRWLLAHNLVDELELITIPSSKLAKSRWSGPRAISSRHRCLPGINKSMRIRSVRYLRSPRCLS